MVVNDSITEAIVLAGGLGTRIAHELNGGQKVVARFGGIPFLVRILAQLHQAGVGRVILALGYKAQDVLRDIDPFIPPDLVVVPSIEESPLGTGGCIRAAIEHISTCDVLVLNGDSFINFPLTSLLDFHKKKEAEISLLLCRMDQAANYGSVVLGPNEEIINFTEKKAVDNAIVSTGVYVFKREVVTQWPLGRYSLELDVLPGLCKEDIYGLLTEEKFLDIGTPETFKFARDSFCASQVDYDNK